MSSIEDLKTEAIHAYAVLHDVKDAKVNIDISEKHGHHTATAYWVPGDLIEPLYGVGKVPAEAMESLLRRIRWVIAERVKCFRAELDKQGDEYIPALPSIVERIIRVGNAAFHPVSNLGVRTTQESSERWKAFLCGPSGECFAFGYGPTAAESLASLLEQIKTSVSERIAAAKSELEILQPALLE